MKAHVFLFATVWSPRNVFLFVLVPRVLWEESRSYQKKHFLLPSQYAIFASHRSFHSRSVVVAEFATCATVRIVSWLGSRAVFVFSRYPWADRNISIRTRFAWKLPSDFSYLLFEFSRRLFTAGRCRWYLNKIDNGLACQSPPTCTR